MLEVGAIKENIQIVMLVSEISVNFLSECFCYKVRLSFKEINLFSSYFCVSTLYPVPKGLKHDITNDKCECS